MAETKEYDSSEMRLPTLFCQQCSRSLVRAWLSTAGLEAVFPRVRRVDIADMSFRGHTSTSPSGESVNPTKGIWWPQLPKFIAFASYTRAAELLD